MKIICKYGKATSLLVRFTLDLVGRSTSFARQWRHESSSFRARQRFFVSYLTVAFHILLTLTILAYFPSYFGRSLHTVWFSVIGNAH